MNAVAANKPRAMRDALLSSIHEAMVHDSDIFFVTADFGSPVLDRIRPGENIATKAKDLWAQGPRMRNPMYR